MNLVPFLRNAAPRIGVLVLVALVLAGCTHRPDNTNPSPSGTQLPIPFTGLTQDLRIRWGAEPGIDLLSGPAVVIRAYRESFVLGGLMASPKFYYPGFEQAVPLNGHQIDNLAIRPYVAGDPHLEDSGFQITTPIVGTWYEHILSLTGDVTSGYTAIVCSWDYATGVQQPDGTYSYENRPPPKKPAFIDPYTGIGLYRITFTPPPPGSKPATPPQRGTAPNATTDVFGGWKIRTADHLATTGWQDEPNYWPQKAFSHDQKACMEKSPDPYEKRLFFINGEHSRGDYPTLPADPGWPGAGT